MYQELEMYKEYKKEKTAKIKHNHEVFASVSAGSLIAIIAIIAFYLV
tara:strand:- start:71 stop:211 length:141 start_codon:yes stop_codon:yes gene_type:complete